MVVSTKEHLLLISEDQGNGDALIEARQKLSDGVQVTWICSTPKSSEFAELEDASALKNAHIGTLNLLVITRNESQPFDVLTGSLDETRLKRCAELLFETTSITSVLVAGTTERKQELLQAARTTLPALDEVAFSACSRSSESAPSQQDVAQDEAPSPDENLVAVKVIIQGRELSFHMKRTAGTLLDGAEDADIDLPFSCRGGVCSTCRAQLREGEVDLIENYALEEWELEAGFTLPCQAEPVSSQITLDYDQV